MPGLGRSERPPSREREPSQYIATAPRAVAMYCEGSRSRDGGLSERPKPGIGRLALESGAPIVPVAIYGSAKVRNWRRGQFPKVTIQFGDPIRYEQLDNPTRDQQMAVAEEIFGEISRSAAAVDAGTSRVVITRPGQVVVLDTTPLPVKVLDDVFGESISVDLTLALDAFTHSLVAFRLTPGSDSSVEVAMLLRDVMLPLPMRPGWGEDMQWPYPGIPAALVAEFAGHPVAGRPFFAPETVTTDHGSVYKNHHLVQVARTLGVVVLPARVMRPTDKAACERAFGGIRSLLLEMLLGYSGIDVADRGADPEGDAVWTLEEMEHLLATWTVRIWQNRQLAEHAPAWDPGGRHSPNTLFAMAGAREGIDLQVPEPSLDDQLLPAHSVMIHGNRGAKAGGLWYDDPVLDPYRGRCSRRSGVHRGEWIVRRDPRDCREVFFEHPDTGEWHPLRWRGLPPGDDVVAFSDARVREVLREAARSGLKPRDDGELLPVLLDLVACHTPVTAWPSQMTKTQKAERARELARARAAATDRPRTRRPLSRNARRSWGR